MLTRLYIDNFRCFEEFEYRPGRKQLIVGPNGTGKSSFMEALMFLRRFGQDGVLADALPAMQPTLWASRKKQVFELEAALGGVFLYRLEIEPPKETSRPRVRSETLQFEGKPVLEFVEGEVQLYDRFIPAQRFPADPFRSALAITPLGTDEVSRFKLWLDRVFCFRLNPFAMAPRAERPQQAPATDLSNFAAWYSHLVQSDPQANFALHQSLRESLDGFNSLKLESLGGFVRILVADFAGKTSQTGFHMGRFGLSQPSEPITTGDMMLGASHPPLRFGFDELSEGQRCLICLYAVLHFVLTKAGTTVVIDEPENFISLREIQPWLMAASDAVDENNSQIILISHHPELIDQWAPSCGVQFVREKLGPVRVVPFHGEPDSGLSPAELIARGWENE
jgi:hypothetical protein